MPRVAIITPWAITNSSVGGTERYCIDLAESLTRHEHNVTVFMFSGVNHQNNKVRYISLDLFGKGVLASEYTVQGLKKDLSAEQLFKSLVVSAERQIQEDAFDAFIINSPLLIKAWPKARRIISIHTNPFEFRLDWGEEVYDYYVHELRLEAKRDCTNIIVPSAHYSKYFKRKIGSAVTCLPHAIDSRRLLVTKSVSELRASYGLSQHKTILLLPSRLEPTQKQPQLIIEALERLPRSMTRKLQVVFTGKDSQYNNFSHDLINRSKQAKVNSRFIKFDDMKDAYRISDIIILPSKSESFGYSALESLSIPKPTVLNNIPTYREIGTGNPNAYFFNKTAESLSDVVIELINNNVMPIEPSTVWVNRYDIENWVSKYEKLIRQHNTARICTQ